MAERKKIGQGFEHTVVESRHHPTIVLKTPRPVNVFLMRLLGQDPKFIKHEIAISQEKIRGTGVLIPPTRIFTFKSSYVMAQSKITADNSIKDIHDYLKNHGTTFLRYKYLHNAFNFISHNNHIYWIDPTNGPSLFRILNQLHPQFAEKYYIFQEYVKRILSFKPN